MVLALRCVAVAAGFDIVHCCWARQYLDPVLNNSRPLQWTYSVATDQEMKVQTDSFKNNM